MNSKTEQISFKDLVRDIAYRSDLSLSDANITVRATFDSIKYHLYEYKCVNIPGFGIFDLRESKPGLYHLPNKQVIWTEGYLRPTIRFNKNFKNQLKSLSRKRGIKDEKTEMDHKSYTDLESS